MQAIDERKRFRSALGSFATGVTVVTARHPEGFDVGVTANSFNSVSLDPPMILWSLNRTSRSLPAFVEGEGFVVHILASDQKAISNRFATSEQDKFADLDFERGVGGAPMLEGCAARFQCRLAFRYDGGDHEILVGEVLSFDHNDRRPIVYHGGQYADLNFPTPEAADTSADGLTRKISRLYHLLRAPAREEFARRGLQEEGYYILRALDEVGPGTFEMLTPLLAKAGRVLQPELVVELLDRGLLEASVSGSAAILDLTAHGRQLMIELLAIRAAAQEDVLGGLERRQVALLDGLLGQTLSHARAAVQPSASVA